MEKKNVVFLTVLAVATLLTAVVGTTFAYFTARVTGNDTATVTTIKAAQLGVTYSDGAQVTGTNIIPGWNATKRITVENTSDVDVTYSIYWDNITNTFVNDTNPVGNVSEENFYYTVVSSSTDEATSPAATITGEQAMPDTPASGTEVAFANHVSLKAGVTHTYTITMNFREANYPQDDNQNKQFSAKFVVKTDNVTANSN